MDETEGVLPKQAHTLVIRLLLGLFHLLWLPFGFLAGRMVPLLHYQYSFTLPVSALLTVFLGAVLFIWAVVRYHWLTSYSRLPTDQETNDGVADMWLHEPAEQDDDRTKTGYPSYFEEFLSAIKIFGYLDRKVFLELTRHMQTYRVSAGESLRLKDIDGFAVVIDGTMQVYTKNLEKRDKGEEFQLLNEVKQAAPLSSLFSILSLFTEDVELSDSLRPPPALPDEDVPDIDLGPHADAVPGSSASTRSQDSHPSPRSKPIDVDSDSEGSECSNESRIPDGGFADVTKDIIAVAKTPSTIAVIPSQAFRDLTRKYPTATANIVQIILLRWSRVTLRTCHHYLNLTSYIYEAEVALNNCATARVPEWLREGAVKRLHALAETETDQRVISLKQRKKGPSKDVPTRAHQVSLEHQVDPTYPGDLLSNAPLPRNQDFRESGHGSVSLTSGLEMRKQVVRRRSLVNALANVAAVSSTTSQTSGGSPGNSYIDVQKLLPQLRAADVPGFTEDSQSEDSTLRHSLIETMFAIVGFDSKLVESASSNMSGGTSYSNRNLLGPSSLPGSPMLSSQGPLGLNLTGISGASDTASMTSESNSSVPAASYENIVAEASQHVSVRLYRKGEKLSEAGHRCPGLFYVLDGQLQVVNPQKETSRLSKPEVMFDVNPGSVAGYLETVTSYSATVDIVAKTDVCVALLGKDRFEKLSEQYPLLYISVAKMLTTRLSRPIIQLDFALEWVNIKAGATLFRQGTEADSIYFVLNGRVRTFIEGANRERDPFTNAEKPAAMAPGGLGTNQYDKKADVDSEYGQGSTLGELEVFVGENYSSTAVAIRETELARFPRSLVESLTRTYPDITFELTRIVATQTMKLRSKDQATYAPAFEGFRTIAVLPTIAGLPVEKFGHKLARAFRDNGRSTIVLTNATILGYLGRYAFNRMGALKLKTLLAELEDQYETIIYVADTSPQGEWTKTCVAQADCVLLLADADSPSSFGEYERQIVKSGTSTRSHLILLHQDHTVSPGSTSRWLKNRPWVTAHYHVQMEFVNKMASDPAPVVPKQAKRLQKLRAIKNRVQEEFFQRQKFRRQTGNVRSDRSVGFKNDFARLSRILSGQAVGIVLGGGGARGISHVGVLRALEEMGIPVDIVGGTSIGSFVGGLYASEYDIVPLYGRAKSFASRMSALWRMVLDITYPATAYTTGHEFNRGIWKAFGDARIEDFWLKYFNNTTNLTHSRMEIHQQGYAWRYIRASMSLAGLVPPIEDKGQMLLDGGYMDNLPVTEMKRQGARYIIAVDVGSTEDTTPVNYGDTLSGLWVILNRWNPFSSHPNVPNVAEIQQRLAYVSSVRALEEAKVSPGVVYMRAPIDQYATLDFGKFDEILSVGYTYAVRKLRELQAENKLPNVPGALARKRPKMHFRRHSI